MAHDVFISTSSKDKPVADAVCATLESRGIRCWMAARDIQPGQNWGGAIIDAIGGSRILVLIYSTHANTSQQVIREIERAVHKNVTVIPFRIEDVPMSSSLEYFISSPHWLDAFPEPRLFHFEQLADTIQRHVAPGTGATRRAELTSGESAVAPTPKRRRGPTVAVLVLLALAAAGAVLVYFWPQAKPLANGPNVGVTGTVDPVPPPLVSLTPPVLEPQSKPVTEATTLALVIPVKAQTEMAWERLKDVDRADGFDVRLDEAEGTLREARTFFEQKEYDEAKQRFLVLRDVTKKIAEQSALRERAKSALTAADAAAADSRLKGAAIDAKAQYSAGAESLKAARAALGRGDFENARSSAEAARAQYAQASLRITAKSKLRESRQAYDKALAAYDANVLKRNGGKAWAAVASAVGVAEGAGEDFSAAAAAYAKATQLLPAADAAAKAEQARLKSAADAVAKAEQLRLKNTADGAAEAEQLRLKTAPYAEDRARQQREAEALRLRQKVAEANDPQIFLNSLGMNFVKIKAGAFVMGTPAREDEREDDERQHRVELTRSFMIGAHEVTVAQFAAFATATGFKNREWRSPDFPQGDDHPVVSVSWSDALAFCEWLSSKEGKKYRLPTEAEWEYACRAGSRTAYAFGDDPNQLGEYAWFEDNSQERTHRVGTKKPNAWGLYDMAGNVYEWCGDGYAAYPAADAVDPKNNPTLKTHVLRGGAWDKDSEECRAGDRTESQKRNENVGFRIVLE
jgi:formylglycine-generating enzyme required for sulfatase activity